MRYWKKVDAQGKTTTVESYSHDQNVDGLVEIDEAEFNAYIAPLLATKPPGATADA